MVTEEEYEKARKTIEKYQAERERFEIKINEYTLSFQFESFKISGKVGITISYEGIIIGFIQSNMNGLHFTGWISEPLAKNGFTTIKAERSTEKDW